MRVFFSILFQRIVDWLHCFSSFSFVSCWFVVFCMFACCVFRNVQIQYDYQRAAGQWKSDNFACRHDHSHTIAYDDGPHGTWNEILFVSFFLDCWFFFEFLFCVVLGWQCCCWVVCWVCCGCWNCCSASCVFIFDPLLYFCFRRSLHLSDLKEQNASQQKITVANKVWFFPLRMPFSVAFFGKKTSWLLYWAVRPRSFLILCWASF